MRALRRNTARARFRIIGYADLSRLSLAAGGSCMQVRAGMSSMVVTVSPGLTLHDAARSMAERGVGAAVVIDPEQPGPGITFAAPDWSLEHAAEAMVRGGFRHLVVVDGGEMIGVLSMRDIVRCWVEDGATSSLPRDAASTSKNTPSPLR